MVIQLRTLTLALAAWQVFADTAPDLVQLDQLDGTNSAQLTIGGFADPEVCYAALVAADTFSEDGRISSDEYAIFVQELGPDDFLDHVESFAGLPLVIQSSFNILACLCQDNPDDDSCCVGDRAGLETAGAGPDENPSPQEQSYLFLVCSLTATAINRVVESEAPSPAPSTAVPTAPAPAPVEIEVQRAYEIGIKDGAPQSDYEQQLIEAMDGLAPEILSDVRRQLTGGLRRRLRSVQLSTTIENVESIACPNTATAGDTCARVTSAVTLVFQPDEANPASVAANFNESLEDAIEEGQLQDALALRYPDSPIYILDDTRPIDRSGTLTDPEDDGSIGGGAVAGAVIGSIFVVGLLVGLLVSRRRQPKEELGELEPAPENLKLDDEETPPAPATLGATSPDYGKGKDAMVDNDDDMSNPAAMSHDSSSNAGSSGWSSSAGISSLNTGSHDGLSTDQDNPVAGIGTTLAAMSAQSKALKANAAGSDTGSKDGGVVSRADLDSAIEAGDWAAVGATAALLAAASDSQSYSSQSRSGQQSQSHGGSSVSSLDAARAAELDNLVDAGDWEGVVLAAAKYEASGEGRDSEASGNSSASRSNTAEQTADSSIGSSPSKGQKRQELRAVVEDLVRRVVPEEIQNVDEMMTQFRGREEELIETLRTMQERAVAQKARQGAQKAAKIQAKQKTAEDRAVGATALLASIPGPGSAHSKSSAGSSSRKSDGSFPASSSRSLGTGVISSQPTAKSLGTGTVEGPAKIKSLGTGQVEAPKTSSERERKQSALEIAIEKGDWEAVGEAAAMLSDHSVASSADTDEINRLAEGLSSAGSVTSGGTGNISDRAEELDAMIEKGDWTGVVEAADGYSKTKDPKTRSNSWFARKKKEDDDEARRQRRLRHLKEEENALAQAEIWMAIAEQTKQDTAEADKGASEAADWAIGRSLQALVTAEQSGGLQDESSQDPPKLKDEDQEEV